MTLEVASQFDVHSRTVRRQAEGQPTTRCRPLQVGATWTTGPRVAAWEALWQRILTEAFSAPPTESQEAARE